MKNLIESLISKIAHDVINSYATIQMAIESDEKEIALEIIDEGLLKIQLYRSVLRNEEAFLNLKKYIKAKELKITIDAEILPVFTLFLINKCSSKSIIDITNNFITCKNINFSLEEIDAINSAKFEELSSFNILSYLAYLEYKDKYIINLENIGNQSWQIKIKNISN